MRITTTSFPSPRLRGEGQGEGTCWPRIAPQPGPLPARGERGLLVVVCALLFALSANAQRVVDQGIAVDFTASDNTFSFRVTDTATGAPISGVRPAAWLAQHRGEVDCPRRVATYLGGDLFNRPDVDLNSYFVLSLNDDDSISVVDPLFGFGGSKLLAMLPLESRGEDWALTPDQKTLFVSLPASNKVAIADTRRWETVKNVATGPNPHRLAFAEKLWVADDEGLTAVDATTFATTRVRVGPVRDLAVSDDLVFAASGHSIAIVDAHTAKILARVKVEGTPSSLAWSNAAKAVLAMDRDAGRVFVVDPRRKKSIAAIEIRAGASQIRFAPNGRHALIANPEENLVQVLDAATNRIVQNGQISDGPDQITFTPLLAYVRRRASEIVLMIPLEQMGAEGTPIHVADFPGGQHAYGEGTPSIADSIVSAPEGPAVLVANPADRMIYLYKEGMAAPAGGFSNYGRQSRAVLVVDRGLRERDPGHYSTTAHVKKPGTYDVIFFVDSPRVVACFATTIAGPKQGTPKVVTRIAAIEPPAHLIAGEPARLRFALLDPVKSEKRRAHDVRALAFEAPGVWQQRGDMHALHDGTYEFEFTPPSSGMYYIWVESESLGLARNHSQFLVYEVK